MQEKSQNEIQARETDRAMKKKYQTPRLSMYGTISQLTQTNGIGSIVQDATPGNNGRNKSS